MKKRLLRRLLVLGTTICLLTLAAGCGQQSDDASSNEQDSEAYTEDEKQSQEEVKDTASGEGSDAEQSEGEDEYTQFENKNLGMVFTFPHEYDNTDGVVTLDCNDVTGSEGVYYAQMSYVGISDKELDEMFSGPSVTEEDSMRYFNSRVPLFSIVASARDRSTKEIVDLLRADGMTDAQESDLTLIKTVDKSSFYDYSRIDTSNYDNIDKSHQDEYDLLVSLKDFIYEESVYSKPISAAEEVPGMQVSFTTMDFNGNTVTSDEIFSKYDVTMINAWATWCSSCVNELEELERINKNLEDKHCAVIGLCADATDMDKTVAAKEILEAKGVTYLNICPFEGWQDMFITTGWPSSFFVGKDGTMLDEPIYGAKVDKYESYIDDILAGKETEIIEGDYTFDNDGEAYVIQVVDNSGQPVENAMVQYCTSDMCQLKPTDKDGKITFKDPPGVYEIHILAVPDGYEENKEVYKTEDHYSGLIIVLNKK